MFGRDAAAMRIGSPISAVHISPVEEPVVVDTPVPIVAEAEPEESLTPVA